jgi:eukaryotic-like serine/threonine-protein kinase
LIERFVDQPVPPRDAAGLVQQLADAVHYAHQKGVLHCGLKPSNVLLTADGVPKITNFGLRAHREQPERWQQLASRRIPSYLAPELADGRFADVGPATDVYALGAILYKLLTGQPPFLADTLAQTWEQMRAQMPPLPSSVQPDVPKILDAVCLKCLAKEPHERYPSAGELAQELGEFLTTERPTISRQAAMLGAIHGYTLFGKLGEDAMSIVYEARHLASGRRVALRTMRPEHRYGEPLRARLRQVAQSVSRLRHPNIEEVQECGDHDGCPFFVTELLSGGSLRRKLDDGEMPIGAAAVLVRTLARAMEAVHQLRIIHGNLQPSKILLAADGTPKISDFIGGWRAHEVSPEMSAMTVSASEVIGTPRYLAPEQLAGETGAIGPPVDVYALGLLLYELLTQRLPFRGAALWELFHQVLHEPPLPPRKLRADVPVALDCVCLRCLAKKPTQRYPSAGALADDLDRFLAGEAVDAAAPQPQRGDAGSGNAAVVQEPRKAPLSLWARVAGWFSGRSHKRQ